MNQEKKRGILLVNLGTPRSYQPKDVRRYLLEFLTDPRVIDLPWIKRQLLVRGVIVPFRYKQSAEQYRKLWTAQGSPLMYHGRQIEEKLQEALEKNDTVVLAMRYQNPSIAEGLEKLQKEQLDELIIFPLFPQYSSATTGSVHQEVMEHLKNWSIFPKITFISHYFEHPKMIAAFCARARQYSLSSYDHILMSFHGLPEKQIQKINSACLSDGCCQIMCERNRFCYKAQCYATAHAIATELGLHQEHYTICFQSRLGKDPWIKPYTSDVLHERANLGDRRLLVLSPSFICDCLETTFEIGEEYGAEFKKLGGEELQLVEGLNDHSLWIDALKEIIEEQV